MDIDAHTPSTRAPRRTLPCHLDAASLAEDSVYLRGLDGSQVGRSARGGRVDGFVVCAGDRASERARISGVLRLLARHPHDSIVDDEYQKACQHEDGNRHHDERDTPFGLPPLAERLNVYGL